MEPTLQSTGHGCHSDHRRGPARPLRGAGHEPVYEVALLERIRRGSQRQKAGIQTLPRFSEGTTCLLFHIFFIILPSFFHEDFFSFFPQVHSFAPFGQ